MKITALQGENIIALSNTQWDFGITSKPVDQRGRMSNELTKRQCKAFVEIEYFPYEMNINVNGKIIIADDFIDQVKKIMNGRILIDSVNLDCGELLLSMSAVKNISIDKFDILYIEPINYITSSNNDLSTKRQYELTEDVSSFKTMPGYGYLMDHEAKNSVVISLGYEGERLDRALEENQFIKPNSVSLIMGVPAFKAGWEMNTFSNNISVITKRNIHGGLHFCPANNPLSVYSKLEKINRSLEKNERMFLFPLGTKPHSIGICLFVSFNTDIGFLYDYPQKRSDQTSKVGSFHLYNICL